jgi:hypothetical protein
MKYGESYRVTTWSRGVCSHCTTLRDFEIFDEEGNLCVSASSKWTPVNTVDKKLIRVTDELLNVYGTEDKKVFEVLDIKAYVDYSIFNSDKSTEKFIRKTILPTLAQEGYHIEIDKLTKASIWSSPQMPKNTHKYKDYVYSTLKNNINKLKRLIQNE